MNYNLKMNFPILITANTTCPKMCEFTMSSWNSDGVLGLKIQIIFNGKWQEEEVEACSSQSQKFMTLYINCSSWNEGKLYNIQNLIVTCMYTCDYIV